MKNMMKNFKFFVVITLLFTCCTKDCSNDKCMIYVEHNNNINLIDSIIPTDCIISKRWEEDAWKFNNKIDDSLSYYFVWD